MYSSALQDAVVNCTRCVLQYKGNANSAIDDAGFVSISISELLENLAFVKWMIDHKYAVHCLCLLIARAKRD